MKLSKKALLLSLTLASASLMAGDNSVAPGAPAYYPKGPNPVTNIYQVDISNLKYGEDMITLQALQGIVAKQSNDQLYLCTSTDHYNDYWYNPTKKDKDNGLVTADKFWLDYLTNVRAPKIQCSGNIDLPGAVALFKKYIKGYVSYKTNLNIAVSYAGVNDYIPLTQNQIKGYGTFGLLNSANADAYNTNADFYKAFNPSINKNLLFELNPSAYTNSPLGYRNMPRDYATMNKAMICFSNPVSNDLDLYSTAPLSVVGWGAQNEEPFVQAVSDKGDLVLPCDWGQNLSLLSSSCPLPAKANTKPMPQVTYDPSKKYVTFIVSDGDNLQLWLNTANDMRWWGNPIRTAKNYPVGWTACPSMFYLAPDAWNFYVNSGVANGVSNDEFICGPSGIGYNYGSVANKGNTDAFKTQLSDLDNYMKDSNMSVLTIFGRSDWNNIEWLGKLAGLNSISGGFYFGYPGWPPTTHGIDVKFLGTDSKPVMYANAFLKDEFQSEPDSSSSNEFIDGTVDAINSNAFTAVYVCKNFNWNGNAQYKDQVGVWILNDIDLVVKQLDLKDIVIVSPSQMISVLKQAHEKGNL